MTPEFTPTDPLTWPVLMTVEHICIIYNRKVGGVKRQCISGTFRPAPFMRRPYAWRRSDVERHLGLTAAEMRPRPAPRRVKVTGPVEKVG
jgi:hypothetical protein